MADTYGIKSLIWNSSDNFKSDFINKINKALNKLDWVGYSTPASATWEPVGVSIATPKKSWTTTPNIFDVAYAMEAPKAKKKKEEKIEKVLGEDSIYSWATHGSAPEEETWLKWVWNRFINKRINKAQEKVDKKVERERALAWTYKTSKDMNLYAPDTYTWSSDIETYPAKKKYLNKWQVYRNYIDDLEELYQRRQSVEDKYDKLNKELIANKPDLWKNYAIDWKALWYESWEDRARAVDAVRTEYRNAHDELYGKEKEELKYIDNLIYEFVNFGRALNEDNYRTRTPSWTLKYDLDAFYDWLDDIEDKYQRKAERLDSLYL